MLYLKGDFLNAGIAWFALGLAVAHIYAIWGRSTSFGSPYSVICQIMADGDEFEGRTNAFTVHS